TPDATGIFVKDAMLLLSRTDDMRQLFVLAGILNSRLLQYLYQNYFATIDVLKNALLALPLPDRCDGSSGQPRYEKMLRLTAEMLRLHKELAAARSPQDKEFFQRRIHATDRQIDRLVYDLYGLTEEEVRVVEEEK